MASTTIHSLVYKMTADTTKFSEGVVLSRTELRKLNKTIDSTKTPLEKYEEELAFLDKALKAGAISQEQFARAAKKIEPPLVEAEIAVNKLADSTFRLKPPIVDTTQKMGKLRQGFSQFAKIAAPAGAVVLGLELLRGGFRSLTNVIQGTISKVNEQFAVLDKLAKRSDKLGVLPEQFQKLSLAARLSADITEDQLGTALQRMVRRSAEAAAGSEGLADAFAQLGVSVEELQTLDPYAMFLEMADGMSRIENQSERVALTFKIFDTEGVNLVNTLSQGSDAIREATKELDRFGIGFHSVELDRIEAANDSWTKLTDVLYGLYQRLAVEFAPIVQAFADVLLESSLHGGDLDKVITDIGRVARETFPQMIDLTAMLTGSMLQLVAAMQKVHAMYLQFTFQTRKARQLFNASTDISATGFGLIEGGAAGNFGNRFNTALAGQTTTTLNGIGVSRVQEMQLEATQGVAEEIRGLRREVKDSPAVVRTLF